MKRVMVRYKVKPGKANENESLIRAVFAELRETGPAGLQYASFKLADGVSFVHLATIDTEDQSNPLSETAAFKAFQKDIKDRCDEPPSAVDVTLIGSYGAFSA